MYLSCRQMRQLAEAYAPAYVADVRALCPDGDAWLERVDAVGTHIWLNTYFDQVNIVLDMLNNTCLSPQELTRHVLLMTGVKGSPKRDMAKAIADYLDLPRSRRAARRQLVSYRRVYILHCREFAAAMLGPQGFDAATAFSRIQTAFTARKGSSSERVVLVLDPIEVLLHQSETERVWRALAAATDIAVVGALDPNEDGYAHATLEGTSQIPIDVVSVRKTTREETYDFLRVHEYPDWLKEDGFTFEEGAFDDVILLEPGIRMNGKRMTFPYLAVDLGQLTIAHVEGSPDGERVLGREFTSALRHIDELLASDERIEHFVPVLQSARTLLADAAEQAPVKSRLQPQDATSVSSRDVTHVRRAQITAQLLSAGVCTFRWEDVE